MLSELYIKNFALIDELRISFAMIDELRVEYQTGLNIITGETGSGKSIMIDALSLALGKKSTRTLVRKGQKKAVVEAVFLSTDEALHAQLEELGIDDEQGQIIISREISADGRSISRINGRSVNQTDLKQVAASLITIHGQNEYEQVMIPANQLKLLDSFAQDEIVAPLKSYQAHYARHQELKRALLELNENMDEARLARELSLLEHEIHEIAESKLKKDEKAQIKERLERAENHELIHGNLEYIFERGYESGGSMLSTLSKCTNKLEQIVSYDPIFEEWLNVFNDAYYTLEDIIREIGAKASRLEGEEEDIVALSDRLDQINQLFRKYGASYEDVMKYRDDAMLRKTQIESRETTRAELEQQIESELAQMRIHAAELTEVRKRTSVKLLERVTHELEDLNMQNAQMEVSFQEGGYHSLGVDQVEFLVSFNKGEALKPFHRVASGGEISRFMLALKTVIAETDEIETLIFDEIDTGVSGISAQKIGEKLKQISRHRQVICITHLPQIASFSDTHFVVEKKQTEEETRTSIMELDMDGRVTELAKMMSGLAVTESTLKTARELIQKNSRQI